MLEALGNIFRIPELRQKIVFTLVMFAVFRMGTHIPVPGVDPTAIEQLFAQGTLFGLLDLFSGGAFSKFSIFAMSITPYINAAIIIQLLNVVVPTLEQWSKEGAEGHKKTTKVTRYLTVALAFFQAIGMSIGLKSAILNPSPMNILIIAITLTAGTVFLMWLGEQITANGIGNGISLIIFAGIVAALPKNIGTIYAYVKAGTISYFSVFAFAVIALAMIVFVIHIETGFPSHMQSALLVGAWRRGTQATSRSRSIRRASFPSSLPRRCSCSRLRWHSSSTFRGSRPQRRIWSGANPSRQHSTFL